MEPTNQNSSKSLSRTSRTLKSLNSLHIICKINIPKVTTLEGGILFLSTTPDPPYRIKFIKKIDDVKYYYYGGGIHLTYPQNTGHGSVKLSEFGTQTVSNCLVKITSVLSGREDQRTTIKIWQNYTNSSNQTLVMMFIFDESIKEYVKLFVKKGDRSFQKTEFIITRERMNEILDKLNLLQGL